MLKKVLALVTLLSVVICCFTGCFLYKGFSYKGIVEELDEFKLERLWITKDMFDLTQKLEDSKGASAYYATDEQKDAEAIYDGYLKAKHYNRTGGIKKVIIGIEKEKVDKDTFVSSIYLIDFQNKKDAEDTFWTFAYTREKEKYHETGKKFGYQYDITYQSNYKYCIRSGVYLSGSTLLLVNCVQRNGYKWGFTANIYKHLGIIDPAVLADK